MSKPTVLVVDDEIGIRGLMQVILEEADCRVIIAGRPSEALQLAEEDRPDMAILDYMLPEMDGTQLGRQLRQRFGETFPLVFMSAMEIPELKLAELSSYLFLPKPFDISNVVEAVESALAPVQPTPLTVAPIVEDARPSQRRVASR